MRKGGFQCFAIEEGFRQPLTFLRIPDATLGGIMAAYAAAACFALNIFAFNSFSTAAARVLSRISGTVRWLGSMTFALYLFHLPILSLLTVYPISRPPSATQMIALVGITFLVVATVGRLCEETKGVYKRFFLLLCGRRTVLLPAAASTHTR
mgnify:CR=1 FL=1